MTDRTVLNLTVREQNRREIAEQIEQFLQQGGLIEVVNGPSCAIDVVGRVWQDIATGRRGAVAVSPV